MLEETFLNIGFIIISMAKLRCHQNKNYNFENLVACVDDEYHWTMSGVVTKIVILLPEWKMVRLKDVPAPRLFLTLKSERWSERLT